jgi:mannose-6-phosphate isomerase-like protein (cupin superfamily)
LKKAKVIRKNETKNFMEGNEHCKLYIETDKIVFGVSILLPGMKGDVDPGHKDAFEIFYVARGKILCSLPDEDLYEELEEGDAILIPPPRPHALINIGEETAIVIWSQAK